MFLVQFNLCVCVCLSFLYKWVKANQLPNSKWFEIIKSQVQDTWFKHPEDLRETHHPSAGQTLAISLQQTCIVLPTSLHKRESLP